MNFISSFTFTAVVGNPSTIFELTILLLMLVVPIHSSPRDLSYCANVVLVIPQFSAIAFNVGNFTVLVPEGWMEIPVEDMWSETGAIDPDMIQIIKDVWNSESYYGWIESVMLNRFELYGDEAQAHYDAACEKSKAAFANMSGK